MESIDAFSNTDLWWLLLGYRISVKTGAIASTYVCYHTFTAFRDRRLTDLWDSVTGPTTNPMAGTQSRAHSNSTSTNDAPNDNDANLEQIRLVNLGLKNWQQQQQQQKATITTSTATSSHAGQQELDASPSAAAASPSVTTTAAAAAAATATPLYLPIDGDDEHSNIRQFPLLTASRSLTSFLDYLAPGQIIGEVLAVGLEVSALWAMSQLCFGAIEPAGWLEQQQKQQLLLQGSGSGSDDASDANSNGVSMFRRWARRFVAGPPVALRRVFGENDGPLMMSKHSEGGSGDGSGGAVKSLVANSFLGAVLYRDALGFAAIPFVPAWVGCLVTPMCVRFNFVVSDLQNQMTWSDIRSIALSNGIRALAYSTAACIHTSVAYFLEQHRKHKRKQRLEKLYQQQEQQQEDTQQQQQQQATSSSGGGVSTSLSPRTLVSPSSTPAAAKYVDYESLLPPNLFGGICSYTVWTHVFSALSVTAWAVLGDVVGLGAVLLMKRFVKPTALRAVVALTAGRMLCQAGTLTAMRLYASKFWSLVASSPAAVMMTMSASAPVSAAATVADKKKEGEDHQYHTQSASEAGAKSTTTTTTRQQQQFYQTPASPTTPQTAHFPPPSAAAHQEVDATAGTSTSPDQQQPKEDDDAKRELSVTPLRKLVHIRLGHALHAPVRGVPAPAPLISPNTMTTTTLQQQSQSQPRRSHGAFPATPLAAATPSLPSATHYGTASTAVPITPSALLTSSVSTQNSSSCSTSTIVNSYQAAAEQSRRRRLQDLDCAFGTCSALCLSHISEAVHSMLSSLQPDNNVRLHALLYLAAVDEYVSAVNHDELHRNNRVVAIKRGQRVASGVHAAAAGAASAAVPASPSCAALGGTTPAAVRCSHLAPPAQSPVAGGGGGDFASPMASPSTAALSFSCTLNNANNNSSCSGKAATSTSTSSSLVYNILEQAPHVQIQQHVFTAQEIAERKALRPAGVKPFFCVSCKHTFKADQRAIVLPCNHLAHDACARRLRADWCPRCCRPFEKPATSSYSVYDFHAAHMQLGVLHATWSQHVLLPPFLWFAEWRRVRRHVVAKAEGRRESRTTRIAAASAAAAAASAASASASSSATASLRTTAPTISSIGNSSSASGRNNDNNNKKNKNSNDGDSDEEKDDMAETWFEALVESQIIFSIPDDFAPSAYGLIDVPIMAALASLGLLSFNRAHERTLAMMHESLVDGTNGISSSTSSSRILPIAKVRC